MAKAELQAFMEKHGITIKADFVPWSRSRNKDEKDDRGNPRLTLNWRVTLAKGGRDIVTADYSAGEAHCPGYNANIPAHYRNPAKLYRRELIAREVETGKRAEYRPWGMKDREAIQPDSCDVLYSLASDSDVIDCATFEAWADYYGYDTDSRKAEAIYRACLEIALKLRNGLGESALQELREACQDY